MRLLAENGHPLALEEMATIQVVRSGEEVRQRREVVR